MFSLSVCKHFIMFFLLVLHGCKNACESCVAEARIKINELLGLYLFYQVMFLVAVHLVEVH